ncbi:MAG: hypothetical protein AAFY26_02970 [Cyanobacteria bacterium J06638_22]
MIDPASIGAGVIVKLAFDEFLKTGAVEATKATVAGGVELVKGLRDRIRTKLQGNERATTAIVEVKYSNAP